MKGIKYIFVALVIIYLCFIWGNSLQSGAQSLGLSMKIVESMQKFFEIKDISRLNHYIRKLAHFSEFAGLALLLCLCFRSFGFKFIHFLIYVLFFGLSAAVTDEFIQFFVDGRGSSVRDIVIDFGGIIFGTFIYKTCSLYIKEIYMNSKKYKIN